MTSVLDRTTTTSPVAAPRRGMPAELAAHLLVGLGLAAAVWAYWPALFSGWDSDDYLFLRTSELTRDGGLLDAAVRDVQGVGGGFRPLALVLFVMLHRAVGDRPVAFHGVLLVAHLASVVAVYLLGRHVIGRPSYAALAAVMVAVHPVAFESVTWVAALNTWGFPLALFSWYLLIRAEGRAPRHPAYVASIILFAVALLFRESAGLIAIMMLVWRWAETRQLGRSVVVTLPYFVLSGCALLAGRWFIGTSDGYGRVVDAWPRQLWRQLRGAFVPRSVAEFPAGVRDVLAVVLLASPLLALAVGRRRLAAVATGFLASILAASLVWAGDHPRYFYGAAALLMLLVTGAVASIPRTSPWRRRFGTASLALLLALTAWWTARLHLGVERYAASSPRIYERFARDAEALGDLPDGTRVFVANVPYELAVFDGFYLDAIAVAKWPDADVTMEMVSVESLGRRHATLRSNERILVYAPTEFGCAALAEGGAPAPVAVAFDASVSGAAAGDEFALDVARAGPLRDGAIVIGWEGDGRGRARWRLEMPWLDDVVSPWRDVEADTPVRVAIVTSEDGLAYQVLVDGSEVFRFASFELIGRGGSRDVAVDLGPFGDVPDGVSIDELGPAPCQPTD